jgi:ribose 5-phosphate isomerase
MSSHTQYPIHVEDYPVHTDANPFCLDPTCPDKEDEEAIKAVAQMVEDGLFTPEEATRFVRGRQL